MNAPTERTSSHTTAEAAQWFIAIRGEALTAAERERFTRWLSESPVHVREYLGIAETWSTVVAARAWPSASADDLIAATRCASNIVPLPGDDSPVQAVPPAFVRRRGNPRALWLSTVAAALAIAVMVFVIVDFWPGPERYSTARGEQRSIVLRDGSVVRVNTLSRLVVRYDREHRRIDLSEGEAFFRVAHDAARPFEVVTPLATVRAVGTQFNVYSRKRDTQVSVVEGRVVVAGGTPSGNATKIGRSPLRSVVPVDLAAGEQVIVTPDLIGPPQPISVTAALAWTQRRLAFENERVDRVVVEFNRYNAHRLEVVDPQLAALRVSGVFDADDPDALVQYLERVQGVQVVADGDTSLLKQPEH